MPDRHEHVVYVSPYFRQTVQVVDTSKCPACLARLRAKIEREAALMMWPEPEEVRAARRKVLGSFESVPKAGPR